ncbi:MAG: hypothetical protein E2O92_07650 [Alphaproteobacteria bacterium]|nr:MAG: hypothetical protein E2O92_07650 [Alphaproteobacteria bacterium]
MSSFVLSMGGALWLCLWYQNWRYWGIVVIGVGMTLAAFTPQPDIMVTGKGNLFAVRDHSGDLVVSDKRASRRARKVWLRRNGQATAQKWSEIDTDNGTEMFLQCDSLSCLYRPPGRPDLIIALVKDPQALQEDCQRTNVVISAVPARFWCRDTELVIDRFDLWRAGGHAIWVGDKGLRVETVADHQGQRPWSKYPPNRK